LSIEINDTFQSLERLLKVFSIILTLTWQSNQTALTRCIPGSSSSTNRMILKAQTVSRFDAFWLLKKKVF